MTVVTDRDSARSSLALKFGNHASLFRTMQLRGVV